MRLPCTFNFSPVCIHTHHTSIHNQEHRPFVRSSLHHFDEALRGHLFAAALVFFVFIYLFIYFWALLLVQPVIYSDASKANQRKRLGRFLSRLLAPFRPPRTRPLVQAIHF
jgi:preprotein translocase subunit SecY